MAGADIEQPDDDVSAKDAAMRWGILVLILAPAGAVAFVSLSMEGWTNQDRIKLCAAMVLSLFLPLFAYSYYFFRKDRREAELTRMLKSLEFKDEQTYIRMFRSVRAGPYFVLSTGIAWVIALAGLMILFQGDKVDFALGDKPKFPKDGSRLVFGMAFLGAYVWGLQYTFRRYVANDLIPGLFFSLSIRMLMAATVALLIYNAYESLPGGVQMAQTLAGSQPGLQANEPVGSLVWPALAFLLGAFPQRGVQWLMARVPIFSSRPDPSVRPLPLEMIEGVQTFDRMRLEELGIESCHTLAAYDFVPMVLKTSYGARQISDWILQAKLCVCCGEAIKDLRPHGIRGLLDVAELSDEEILVLAKDTAATESSLRRARNLARKDPEIGRLRAVAGRLGEFTEGT